MLRTLIIAIVAFFPGTAFSKEESIIFRQSIIGLEKATGGRIGVAVLNTSDRKWLNYHADERFALTSTFKVLLAAAILSRVDAGTENLERAIPFDQSDILSYAPVTSEHLSTGEMTVSELCAASIELSDNTAANLLLETLGGPKGLTDYLRSLGDETTRLDRNEPGLNKNTKGDGRDTTTPRAMASTLEKILLGKSLSPESGKLLRGWMITCKTGKAKLRAGIDPTWKIGNKTGSGGRGASNDVAIIWPMEGKPFLITVYCSGLRDKNGEKDSVIAEVGRITVATLFPDNAVLDSH
ncbi:MAG: class A beta-lactamase [Luteolibacter sp.]